MGQPSRPAMVTPWGKCLASVKTTIPKETEPAVARGKRRAAPGTTGAKMSASQFHRPKPAEVVNAFERIRQNTPSVFCTAKERQYADRKQKQTAHVEKMRDAGVDIGAVHGIGSRKANPYQHIKRAP